QQQQQPAQQPARPPQQQQQQAHPQPTGPSNTAAQSRAASAKPDHGASSTILGSVPPPWDARPAKRECSRGPVESDNDASGTPRPVKQGRVDAQVGQGAAGAGTARAGRRAGEP
ncbi:hypothetical protein DENSPDRAFT_886946, partial [Dentipellis sp. KUC8613]